MNFKTFLSLSIIALLFVFPAFSSANQTVTVCGVEVEWNGYTAVEPEPNIDINTVTFSDFDKEFFSAVYPVTVETYKIEEGKITETTVTHIHSENEGPAVYVVAGVHGDERAAWYAGLMLGKATISSGDLYVMAPANANGARNFTRYVSNNYDLNRQFPGDPEGNIAQQLAYAIFQDVKRVMPDILLDLHEAIIYSNSRDFLGSTFIFTSLDEIGDLFFEMLFSTQDGTLCHNEFGYNGPGPAGSINSTVTNTLGVPAITVETFRGFQMDRRLSDQLDTVEFVLDYYGMR